VDARREKACETALRFYQRTLPLQPTCYILHLEWNENQVSKKQHRGDWLRRLNQSLEFMVASGLDPRLIAVENLAYPLEWVRDLVEAMGMSFCLDMGHLLRYGYELREYFDTFLGRTSMVHLHGVRDGVDHRGLEFISKDDWALIVQAIETYGGGLSVEVFSLDDLRASLVRLEELRR
jgi:sugar phosphate isomerase/epimerase